MKTSNKNVVERVDGIRGNYHAVRALEVALAGGHSIVFVGCADSEGDVLASIAMDAGAKGYFIMPCPCGHFGSRSIKCSCSPAKIMRYRSGKKVKSRTFDDIQIEVNVPRPRDYTDTQHGFKNAIIRIDKAKQFLPMVSGKLEPEPRRLLDRGIEALGFGPKTVDSVVSVSKTIAALDGSTETRSSHVAEAIQYKMFNRGELRT